MNENCRLIAFILLTLGLLQEVGAQTIAEAVDATNLVWTSDGTGGIQWASQTSTTFDGMDAAQSGPITHNQRTWIQTTVIGPGTVSFWWKVSSCEDEDYLRFYFINSSSTNLQDSISGLINWNYRTFNVPAGTNTLRWSYEKDDAFNCAPDRGWVDQIIYSTNAPIPLETALDTCGVTFTSGGNSNPTYWTGQTNVTHDGIDAAESGAVFGTASAPQESWMETTVSGATNVSFWWKVSSSSNQAQLEFYIGSTRKTNITGEVNWRSNFFTFSGSQTLKWRYVKSNSIAGGSDRGWVDQVVISPATVPASITNQPQSQTALLGTNTSLSVGVGGTGPFSFQWRRNGSDIAGATTSLLSLNPVLISDAGTYSVLVSNICGSALSSNATLTVAVPPSISLQPSNATALAGSSALFAGDATGSQPLQFQWLRGGNAISGATSNVLALTNVQAGDAAVYSLAVSNAYGGDISSNAMLTVLFPPTISLQPTNLTVVAGGDAVLIGEATGTGPLLYQWRRDGNDLMGATDSTLTITNTQAGDAGDYSLSVSNAYGADVSSNALLTVVFPPAILTQPAGGTAIIGASAMFDVQASGTGPLSYQWRLDGGDIASATTSAYLLMNLQAADAGDYSVFVTNAYGSTLSSNALLVLLPPPILLIQLSGGEVTLSWPVDYPNFGLQAAPDVVSGVWTNVPAVLATNGLEIQTALPLGTESLYYRLKQP